MARWVELVDLGPVVGEGDPGGNRPASGRAGVQTLESTALPAHTHHRREIQRLDVGKEGEAHFIDIGQLVAGRIDADIIRVAPQGEDRVGGPRNRCPSCHGRAFRVFRGGVTIGKKLSPGLESGCRRCFFDIGLGRVRLVEFL